MAKTEEQKRYDIYSTLSDKELLKLAKLRIARTYRNVKPKEIEIDGRYCSGKSGDFYVFFIVKTKQYHPMHMCIFFNDHMYKDEFLLLRKWGKI